MLKVGLTGGYASGKTSVARHLQRLGCYLIFADQLGHQVLQRDGEAYSATVETFGQGILADDGEIDRKKLGRLVFHNPELLAKLNSYVHPAVFLREDRLVHEFVTRQPRGIAVIEAAILVETGRYRHFDCLIVTVCSEELQVDRARARDGLSEEQVRARLRMQMPTGQRKTFADFVIDTGGSEAETQQQAEAVYRQLAAREQSKTA